MDEKNVLSNGLTLLQYNPDMAAQLDRSAEDFGWLYLRVPGVGWVTHRQLSEAEIEVAAAQTRPTYGTKVRS